MRRLLTIILCLAMVLTLGGCSGNWKDNAVEQWDNMADFLSRLQITKDDDLIGSRTLDDKDYYIGSYSAECESADGRDVVFGGASVYEKKLKVVAKVETQSGSATFRIRIGTEVEEYTADENGNLELELELDSGNIYIMIDYENFSGTVEMTSEHYQEETGI